MLRLLLNLKENKNFTIANSANSANGVNSKNSEELLSTILANKDNNLHTVFCFYDLNKGVFSCNKHNNQNNQNNQNNHICKLYNLQKHCMYCKACNNNNTYLLNLKKIAYLKKNNTNTLCIYLRKKFDKISKLENLYITETENYRNYKESLKSNPTIYCEAKKQLANYNKKKKKIHNQIVLAKNKLLNNRYNYIILFKTVHV